VPCAARKITIEAPTLRSLRSSHGALADSPPRRSKRHGAGRASSEHGVEQALSRLPSRVAVAPAGLVITVTSAGSAPRRRAPPCQYHGGWCAAALTATARPRRAAWPDLRQAWFARRWPARLHRAGLTLLRRGRYGRCRRWLLRAAGFELAVAVTGGFFGRRRAAGCGASPDARHQPRGRGLPSDQREQRRRHQNRRQERQKPSFERSPLVLAPVARHGAGRRAGGKVTPPRAVPPAWVRQGAARASASRRDSPRTPFPGCGQNSWQVR